MAREAERARRDEREAAQTAYAAALAAGQSGYRSGVDKAVLDERRVAREADRAYADAVRLADVALKTAVAAAERVLNNSLSALADARELVAACREELAAITESARRAETEEFERFRRELASSELAYGAGRSGSAGRSKRFLSRPCERVACRTCQAAFPSLPIKPT